MKLLQAIWAFIEQLYYKAPYPTEIPPEIVFEPIKVIPKNNMLNTFCLAIRSHEGWTLLPPSRSVKNNNPGNCRFSPVGYLPEYGPVGKDANNFAIFKDYGTGYLYLKNLVKHKVDTHPHWNFYDFFSNYAPNSDNNDSKLYAEVVAKACGVSPNHGVYTII